MLPRNQRLRRTAFAEVARARAIHGSLFTTRFLPESDQVSKKQFSVVVSKKVAPSAVERNAIRRKMYATIQECGTSHAHAIFYMKPESRRATYQDLAAAVVETLAPGRAP